MVLPVFEMWVALQNKPTMKLLPFSFDPGNQTLVIDGSALISWGECPTKAWFKHVAGGTGLAPSLMPAALCAGGALHEALRVRYTRCAVGAVPPDCRAAMDAAVWQYYADNPPVESWRTPEEVLRLIDAYLREYPTEAFNVLDCETGFCHDLDHVIVGGAEWLVRWMGKRDLVISYHSEPTLAWCMDHKTDSTESNLYVKWQQNRSQLGYVWSWQQQTGVKPEGFVMNILRWREPLKEKPLKKDGTPRKRRDDEKPRHEFFRVPIRVEQWQLDEWRAGVLHDAASIIASYQSGVWPKSAAECPFCPFAEPCSFPPEQRLRAAQQLPFKPNTWSPMHE